MSTVASRLDSSANAERRASPPRAASHVHDWFAVAFCTMLAATLSMYEIGAKSLWRDEAYSVLVARLDWSGVWRVIAPAEANSGLYYLLLHIWSLFGTTELAVRSLSALFATATIPVVYALANRLFGPRHAAIAALLVAVNAFFIRYAQEARGYALVLFLVTAASYLFISGLDTPTLRRWAAYAIVAALAVYAHFFAALVVAAHAMFALLHLRGRPELRRPILLAFACVAILVSPLLVPVSTVSHLNWIARPSPRDLVGAFQALAGAGGAPLLVAYFAASCTAVVATLGSHRTAGHGRAHAFVLLWLFVPVLTSYLVSILLKPVFTPRYLIVSLPALSLVAAAGVLAIRSRWLRVAALAALALLSVNGLARWYRNFQKENWREATAYVLERSRPGDAIAFHSVGTRAPFDYYLSGLRPRVSLPRPLRPADPWGALDPQAPDSTAGFVSWLAALPAEPPRLWLVLKYPVALPPEFSRRYCAVDERNFSGAHVALYQRGRCRAA